MHMLGRLASATDPQQPQAPHCFVASRSLTYTGRFWLGLHWQGTFASDHLCSAKTTRGQICVVCKKDSYQQGSVYMGHLGHAAPPSCEPRAHFCLRFRCVCRVRCACGMPQRLQAVEQTMHEREWGTPCSGAATRRPASQSRLWFMLAKDCCSTSNKEYV
jgi:hypothetical protein